MKNNLLEVINIYEPIITNFRKRSDVISGTGLGWKGSKKVAKFEDTPRDFGTGTGTTGWCVSASEALLYDEVFQMNLSFRKARAKLISIDIKEQYYGYCYNGSQNKWHTAILVEDGAFKFVIDITCRQFGNFFVDKDIWDFETWQNTLRSPFCNHNITDFQNNTSNILPISNNINKNLLVDSALIYGNLKSITNLTDTERDLLVDFGTKKVNIINEKLLLKNVSKIDYKYIEDISNLLMHMPFQRLDAGFSVLSFVSKQAALNWLEVFMTNDTKLQQYLFVSKSLEDSCIINNIDIEKIHKSKNLSPVKDKTFIVFEFKNLFGIDSTWFNSTEILLPYGIELVIKKEDIFNSGKLITPGNDNIQKETNTIIVRVENM